MKFSSLVDTLKPNIFSVLEEKKQKLLKDGVEIINLSIGSPDLPPPKHVMDAVSEAAQNPLNYKYSIIDTPSLKDSVVKWYKNRYEVSINENELTSVYGSQEGVAHIAFALCDPGDLVIVGTPGYPIFAFGPLLAKCELYPVLLKEENDFLFDFDAIDSSVAEKAKMIIVSYPSNPLSAVANDDFYERLIAFAKKFNIVVIHDNAYSEFIHDGEKGGSFLKYDGAKDVGIEFNSLSKSYNLTGLRISFAVGNSEIIEKFKALRSQIDYGISFIDQIAAVSALTGNQDVVEQNRIAYKERRDALCGGLTEIGWNVPPSKATMFSWVPIPKGHTSEKFSLELLDKTGIIVVPGTAFGEGGEGYVRIALVEPVDVMKKAIAKIAKSGLL